MKLSMKIQLKFFQGLAEQDSFSLFQDERFKELYCQAQVQYPAHISTEFHPTFSSQFSKVMR